MTMTISNWSHAKQSFCLFGFFFAFNYPVCFGLNFAQVEDIANAKYISDCNKINSYANVIALGFVDWLVVVFFLESII